MFWFYQTFIKYEEIMDLLSIFRVLHATQQHASVYEVKAKSVCVCARSVRAY